MGRPWRDYGTVESTGLGVVTAGGKELYPSCLPSYSQLLVIFISGEANGGGDHGYLHHEHKL